ncbi:hypothetical protein BaRGS_00005678 [Batillaria attramentaria]|uniref:Uncharacterized protein n=1 Tax=Batillaria attramentaria TaxID=370345 RepID=A0ABD0LVR0_9CAEN
MTEISGLPLYLFDGQAESYGATICVVSAMSGFKKTDDLKITFWSVDNTRKYRCCEVLALVLSRLAFYTLHTPWAGNRHCDVTGTCGTSREGGQVLPLEVNLRKTPTAVSLAVRSSD